MGSPIIWLGNKVKSLKSIISLNGGSELHSGTTNPSSVAVDAPIGSLYLNSSTGSLYRKTDAGSSTNWSDLSSGGGANTALSNLAGTTALNSSLLPGTSGLHVGFTGAGQAFAGVAAESFKARANGQIDLFNSGNNQRMTLRAADTGPTGVSAASIFNPNATLVDNTTNALQLFTQSGTNASISTGKIALESGNNAGAGPSGPIELKTGTAGGLRGKILLDGSAVNIANGTANPSSAADGDVYYNTSSDKLMLRANSVWQPVSKGKVTTLSADTTLDATHGTVVVDHTAADRTITLPSAASVGQGFEYTIIVGVTSFARNVYVAAFAGEYFDNYYTSPKDTLKMNWPGEKVRVVSDGTGWQIVDHTTPNVALSYVPTLTNAGTSPTVNYCEASKVGGDLIIRADITLGSSLPSSPFKMTMIGGGNLPFRDDLGFDRIVGWPLANNGSASAAVHLPLVTSLAAYEIQFGRVTTASTFTPANTNALAAAGNRIAFTAIVPILGWDW